MVRIRIKKESWRWFGFAAWMLILAAYCFFSWRSLAPSIPSSSGSGDSIAPQPWKPPAPDPNHGRVVKETYFIGNYRVWIDPADPEKITIESISHEGNVLRWKDGCEVSGFFEANSNACGLTLLPDPAHFVHRPDVSCGNPKHDPFQFDWEKFCAIGKYLSKVSYE